ncbi:MAG: hypothetical protein ACI8PB_004615 [Desulforhopalus sp.]|jgi:hypothetical protein
MDGLSSRLVVLWTSVPKRLVLSSTHCECFGIILEAAVVEQMAEWYTSSCTIISY